MLKLYNFGPFGELPDPSPFCVKVDLYLRLAGLPFETVSGVENMRKAPKGKLPFIEDGDERIPDSSFIIEYLQKKYGDPLDADLSAEQRAIARGFAKMMDEHLYWCLVWMRWASDALWPEVKAALFGKLPPLVRNLIAKKARSKVLKDLYAQGVGRHSREEILHLATADLKALADYLGDKSYFFGDKPSSLDAVAFGFLSELALAPLQSEETQIIKKFPNLVSYCHRVQSNYYSAQASA